MGSASKQYQDEQWLRREYVEKNRSAPDIASGFDISSSTIYYFVEKYDLPEVIEEVELECDYCGKDIVKKPSQVNDEYNYCSKQCHYDHRSDRDDWGLWSEKDRVSVVCDHCGETFEVHPCRSDRARFCDEGCLASYLSENQVGEDHPDWRGGWEEYYGPDWDKTRRKARERDDYECVVCGRSKEELDRHPDVHHIRPVMDFETPNEANTLDNVITVCREHHSMIEGWGLAPDIPE